MKPLSTNTPGSIELLFNGLQDSSRVNLHERESRQLQDLMPFVLYSASLEPEFKVFWITENVKHLTGFTSGQFERNPELWPSRIHPDDRERTLTSINSSATADPAFVEYRWQCSDGKYRWFLDTFNFLRDEEGNAIEMVGCWFDITKRKSAEESRRQLSSIIESSEDAIISLTMQGFVVSWNASAAKIYGYSADEMIGQPIFKLLFAEQKEELKTTLDKVRRGGHIGHQEMTHRTRAGTPIDVALTISPVRDVSNNIAGTSIIARDISSHKRLQNELAQINQKYTEDLKRLTHAIQHAQEEERRRLSRDLHDDLNQRLSNLKLNIELLVNEATHKHRSLSSTLRGFAQQLDSMICDVRAIAANLRPPILDDFGLAVALRILCRDFEKLYHRKVSLETCEYVTPSFSSDVQIALYRLAQESFTNIAKHSTATTVDVKLLRDDTALTMIIYDNGKGFDLNEVRSRESSARGLGLTGMKERIETIGGKFHIESSPGMGTRIKAEIPIEQCT